MNKTSSKSGLFDTVFSLILFTTAFAVRMTAATASAILESDEIIYIESGRLYISSLVEGRLFAPWWFNFEHPALAKYLIGLSTILLPLPTHIAARLPSVVLGSLTCVILYYIGKETFGEKAGVIGSTLLAFNVRSIIGSKEAMLEAPLTFFMVLSILLLYSSLQSKSMRRWLLSAVSFGLAMACKFSAIFLTLNCITYVFFMRRRKREASFLCLIWLAVGAIIFYLIQPRFWLDPIGALWESAGLYWRRAQKGRWYDTYFMGETYDIPPLHYLVVVMIAEATPFETIAMLSGLLLLLSSIINKRLTKDTVFLCLMILSPFVYLSLIPLRLSHYLVMCMPGMMLLAAYGTENAFKPTANTREFAATFLLSILLVSSVGSVLESYPSLFYYNPIIGRENYTYLIGHPGGGVTEAVEWIRQNVPENTRVGLIGYEQEFQQLDDLRKYVRFNYRASLHHVRDVNKIRYLVVQINMAERIQNPLWRAVSQMDPVFIATLRGVPTILIFDFGPRE